ncbi:MAG TPA: potassium channel family protein [Candidatus Saccharibacteria bacterium]|nr:potassium channel family protein [Candidatus Saccharibacteria bacterium]
MQNQPHKSYKEQTLEEYKGVIQQFRMAGVTAITLLTIGAVFFHYVQKLSWLDAFYFCTISLATIGYGDITPTTPAGKIFIMFYVVIGIGIIATFANLVVRRAVLRREIRRINSDNNS